MPAKRRAIKNFQEQTTDENITKRTRLNKDVPLEEPSQIPENLIKAVANNHVTLRQKNDNILKFVTNAIKSPNIIITRGKRKILEKKEKANQTQNQETVKNIEESAVPITRPRRGLQIKQSSKDNSKTSKVTKSANLKSSKTTKSKVNNATDQQYLNTEEIFPIQKIIRKGRAIKTVLPVEEDICVNSKHSENEKQLEKCVSDVAGNEQGNIFICSWNVSGIKSWVNNKGLKYLEMDRPDILCIQDIMCSKDEIPEEVINLNIYKQYWLCSSNEESAGVGILTRTMPLEVQYGINDAEHEEEGRCITAEFEKFYVVCVCVPQAGTKLNALEKRLNWNECFKNFVKTLDQKKPVVICGDMNVAHDEIDLGNPKLSAKKAGFTKEEREGLTNLLEDGYIDTFRKFYPEKTGAYTFWSGRLNTRSKKAGWRLDYILVSNRFINYVQDSLIKDKVFGSKHCPILSLLRI